MLVIHIITIFTLNTHTDESIVRNYKLYKIITPINGKRFVVTISTNKVVDLFKVLGNKYCRYYLIKYTKNMNSANPTPIFKNLISTVICEFFCFRVMLINTFTKYTKMSG